MSATSRPPAAATPPASLIDLERDQVVPVKEGFRDVTGCPPSPSTQFRMIHRGTRGGKLEAVCIGGKWYTTRRAIADYVRRQTEASLTQPAAADDAAEPPAERPLETAAALRERGIKLTQPAAADDADEPPAERPPETARALARRGLKIKDASRETTPDDADDPPAERPPEVTRALRRHGIKVDDADEPPAPKRRKRRAAENVPTRRP